MAKIAFILLCHKDVPAIIQQAERLSATGDYVSIHFDARADPEDFATLVDALGKNPGVAFAGKRIKCGWGEWSLVRASLSAVEAAVTAFPKATHFYMLSGDCMPIKSVTHTRNFLDRADRDYIESHDFFASDWIKTGFKEERLIYRHWVNERRRKKLFYAMVRMQQSLRLSRSVPEGLEVMVGSQWWCLRRSTIEKILEFGRMRRDVVRFFATTWIPDETYFQTLVRHLVPAPEIENRTLTFKIFSDYGMPVTFYNDHYDFLISQDDLFARKISPEAVRLKDRLGTLWASDAAAPPGMDDGAKLFRFLANRGRFGRRYGVRVWERESTLGPDKTLYILVCKKWHVAKRLVEAARDEADLNGIEYLFDEASCALPYLGGLERTLNKRNRHRRALLRMLYEAFGTDRLLICVDPANIDLMRDFMSDRAEVRLLEVKCDFDDRYLAGHAQRVGLVGPTTPDEVTARLLPALRHEFADQSRNVREADFTRHWRLQEGRSVADNAEVLSGFLGVDEATGRALAETPHLFSD